MDEGDAKQNKVGISVEKGPVEIRRKPGLNQSIIGSRFGEV
jgi:hypothetical protein